MKYISIDIETTGLDPDKHHILEFAAVLEDTEKPDISVEELPYYQTFIHQMDHLWDASTLNFHMNNGFFNRISKININVCQSDKLGSDFKDWLIEIGIFDGENLKDDSCNVAGKNYANFDHQFLKRMPKWNDWISIRRRMIDPAILYYKPGDEYLPNMATCLERAGLPTEVTHRALDDARQVIELIRIGLP